MTPRFEQVGSIKAGTATSRLLDISTELDIDSPAPVVDVRELVRIAEAMCFMSDVIRTPHEIDTTTRLNGDRLDP